MIPVDRGSNDGVETSEKEGKYIRKRVSFDNDGEPLIKNSYWTRNYSPTSKVKVYFSSNYMGSVDLYEFVEVMRKMNLRIKNSPQHIYL